MLIYYGAVVMKRRPCSIFCAGAFTIHHDSEFFQTAGTTGLSPGSLSCVDALYLSPGAPAAFPPSCLLPHLGHSGCSPEVLQRASLGLLHQTREPLRTLKGISVRLLI